MHTTKEELHFIVKKISATDTYSIRHFVLWPNLPISEVKISEDNDATHFGAYVDSKLVGVISLFCDGENFQFRKLAVLNEYRGYRIGQKLVYECIVASQKHQAKILWCDARCSAIDFYKKIGFRIDPKIFIKNNKDYQKAYFDLHELQSK